MKCRLLKFVSIAFVLIGSITRWAEPMAVAADPTAKKPNVIMIIADDMGYSDLGCYGGEIETPNLDRLAQHGLRFTQFYNTARCWPTRSALMSGFYAQQIHRDKLPNVAGGGQGKRPDWAGLLPEMLKPQGYRSYHSGKWHIDGKVLAGGFDHSYLLDGHNNFFNPVNHSEDDKRLPNPSGNYYATTAIADYALKYLKEHHEQYQDQPFFAYVAFTSPHFPLHALPSDIDKYRAKYTAGWDALRASRWQSIEKQLALPGTLSKLEPDMGPPYHFPDDLEVLGKDEVNRELAWDQLTESQKAFQSTKMAIHAAMVDRMDQEIGRIVAYLRETSQLDNTLIMFCSDNGASAEIMVRGDGHDRDAPAGSAKTFLCLGPGFSRAANTPFRKHKTWVHEGGISTPLIVHWPAGIKDAGNIRQQVGHVIDIVPTVLEATGAAWPAERQGAKVPAPAGQSLLASIKDAAPAKPRTLWWLHEGNRALRVGQEKIVATSKGEWELFDLSVDRAETNDLAASKPDRVKALAEMWQAMTDEFEQLAKP